MNTVIVPVDFSETSLNAANYAAQLLSERDDLKIILFHLSENVDDAATAPEKLDELVASLSNNFHIVVEGVCLLGSNFIEQLEKQVKIYSAGLVIMGITSRSELAQVFVSSNTLKLAETKVCPVLIVPEAAKFTGIKSVMLASDFKNVYYTTPAEPIKAFLKTFKPELHIVNVNSELYIALTEQYEKEKQAFIDHFSEFSPEFYFLRLYDIEESIHQFAEAKNIDIIITIQHEHPLLGRIFKTDHAKKLSYSSSLPVLVVHE
jgi:nucleotide-binding universal stress UspA family protein